MPTFTQVSRLPISGVNVAVNIPPTPNANTGKVDPRHQAWTPSAEVAAAMALQEKFDNCLTEKNKAVDAGGAENYDMYAPCYKLKPEYSAAFPPPAESCAIIAKRRLYDGTNRTGKTQNWPKTVDEIPAFCNYKVSLIHPPKETIWDWVDNAVSSAGRAIEDAANAIADIPVLGTILQVAYSGATSPFKVAVDIANGQRIDRAVMGHFERELANAKTIAPYAQVVISFIPGIGPIASAAIGTAIALANGKRIDQAILEGVKSALPGGPLAKMAFEVGQGLIEGKPIEQIGLAVLPIPQTAKDYLAIGLKVTRALAEGQSVDKVLLQQAVNALPLAGKALGEAAAKLGAEEFANKMLEQAKALVPANMQKVIGDALTTGVALAQGQKLQELATKTINSPAFQNALLKEGRAILDTDRIASEAYKLVPGEGYKGFVAGLAMMRHQISKLDFDEIKKTLNDVEAKAFDTAVSLRVGQVNMRPPQGYPSVVKAPPIRLAPPRALIAAPGVSSQMAQAGYFITRGMVAAPEEQKVDTMKMVATNPVAKIGAVTAIKEIAESRLSLWQKILQFLGLVDPIGAVTV